MASFPSAPPPSYEEAINLGPYYPLHQDDVPPPYAYDNYSFDVPSSETPPPPPGPSAGGATAQPAIFVVRPSSAPSSNQIDPIALKEKNRKPRTPKPTANPTPNSNSTPASNPTPNQASQPRNRNTRRASFSNKIVLRGFFHHIYLVLVVQAGCILAIGAGIYSNEYIRDRIAVDNNTFRGITIGLMIAAMFFTWTMTDIRKKNRHVAVIFMIIFNLILSFAVMVLASSTGSIAPLICVGITAVHGIVIQIFLHQKKIAFTLISGMIFTFVTVCILSGISIAIFGPVLACLIGGPAALAFGWWVMILLWCMVDDRNKYNHKPEDYLALQPYVYAGILFLPFILLSIMFCKFEWSKYK